MVNLNISKIFTLQQIKTLNPIDQIYKPQSFLTICSIEFAEPTKLYLSQIAFKLTFKNLIRPK